MKIVIGFKLPSLYKYMEDFLISNFYFILGKVFLSKHQWKLRTRFDKFKHLRNISKFYDDSAKFISQFSSSEIYEGLSLFLSTVI